jgi:hydroxyacylglutathione hydrolase
VPPAAGHDEDKKVLRVSAEELKKLIAEGKAVIVDVRAAEVYKAEHIKGAMSLPLDKIEAGQFKELPHDKRIITYCSCPAENSSVHASVLIGKAGFKDVGTLLGGTAAWEKAGGEMIRAKSNPRP